jgi:prolipoprotein diacylglyceryltransferase
LNGQQVRDLNGARAVLQVSGPELTLESRDGDTHRWTIGELPLCSLRIHATQIYAAVNAALILFVLYSFFPFRTRDGQVLAWMATLYPITRFLLEWVRDDEPGRFGTPLTIAQWVSIATIVPAMGLWIHLARGRLEARTT